MPPSEASAPGSIGKNTPVSRKYSLSCLRVMPGSMTQSRSSACTASTRFMSRNSRQTPPRGALAEADHRHAMRRAKPHDVLDVRGGLRKRHCIRRLIVDPGRGVAVLLAHRLRGDEPIAVTRGKRRDHRIGGLALVSAAFGGFDQSHYCSCLFTSNVAAGTAEVKIVISSEAKQSSLRSEL